MLLDFPAQGAYAVYIVRMGDTGDGSVRDEINAIVGRIAALAYAAERPVCSLAPRLTALSPRLTASMAPCWTC